HPSGWARPDQGAGAALLRPAHGSGRASSHPRHRHLLRLPTLFPQGSHSRCAQGVSVVATSGVQRAASRARTPAYGFDLDGVLMVNPFDTCVVPRLEALVSGSPTLAGLSATDASKRVRQAIGRGWRRRMATGDLAAAYDWDGIYREVATELAVATSALSIDVARWVEECCMEGEHIRALPGAGEMLSTLLAAGARLVVISNGFARYQEPV